MGNPSVNNNNPAHAVLRYSEGSDAKGRTRCVAYGFRLRLGQAMLYLAICIIHVILANSSRAVMTQEDVFKSIKENVSETEGSGRTFMAILLGGVAVVMLLALFSARNKREATPKALNHAGKLLKELIRQISLRPAELKQLKLLAEAEQDAGVSIDSPLIFLLCPSTLTAAMRSGRVKIDRKVMAGVARKLGLVAGKK